MARRFDDDPALVVAAQGGDEAAFTTLFRRWFDPCFDVARRIVHNDDTAAEVAQETFLVAWRQISTLRDPSAFGGWVLRTSRNKALNRLEKERRSVAVDQDEAPVLAGLEAVDDVAGEVAAADQQQLVWAAAAALGERDASVLDLHLRHGLDASEIAEALDVTTNNAHQLLFRMKGKLAGSIRAWVLFKGGDPQCVELGRVLRQAGTTSFSAATVKVIGTHVDGCEECTGRQAAVLAPEAMFAAVPLLPVGAVLRDRVTAALRTNGVPLGPDAVQPLSWSEAAAAETNAADTNPADTGADGSASAEATATASAGPTEVVPVAAGAGRADGDGGTRTKVLAAVGVIALLLLSVGGWLVLRGDGAEVDLVGAPVATTTPGTEPRTGTSVPVPPPDALAPVESTTTTVAPAPPSPGASSTLPPPVTAPPAPPPPPPSPPTPAPTITTFSATPASTPGGACPPGQWAFTLTWSTTDTTDVLLIDNSGLSEPLPGPPSGTAVGCGLTPGGTWTLVASGPGGQASRTD